MNKRNPTLQKYIFVLCEWGACEWVMKKLLRNITFTRIWSLKLLNHFLLFILVCSSSFVPEEVDFNMVWCCYSAAVAACLAAGLRHLLYRNVPFFAVIYWIAPHSKVGNINLIWCIENWQKILQSVAVFQRKHRNKFHQNILQKIMKRRVSKEELAVGI